MIGKKDASISEVSINTQLLCERLSKLEVEELISYDVLSRVAGLDVRGKARHNLLAARRRVLGNHKIATGCVSGRGIKRLSDTGIVQSFSSDLRSINRKSRRSRRKIVAIEKYRIVPFRVVSCRSVPFLPSRAVSCRFRKGERISYRVVSCRSVT